MLSSDGDMIYQGVQRQLRCAHGGRQVQAEAGQQRSEQNLWWGVTTAAPGGTVAGVQSQERLTKVRVLTQERTSCGKLSTGQA